MKPKTIAIHLADIKQVFDVRKRLDDDRVMQFALLYERGSQLPPIEVTTDYTIIDGRHRVAAADLAKRETIEAVVVDEKNEVNRIERAFKANIGGSLPPTKEDIYHTIHRLLELGLSQKQIVERLPYDRPVARCYVETAASSRAQAMIKHALMAMTDDNLSAAQAAEKFKVPLEKIKLAITGKRKKVRDTATLKGASTSAYNGLSKRNGILLKRLLNSYEDGTLPARSALEIADHLEKLIKLQLKMVINWKMRFESVRMSMSKPHGTNSSEVLDTQHDAAA